MPMDDRVILRGGPLNDTCAAFPDGRSIADLFVIEATDDDGHVHLYSLDMDYADLAFYNWIGLKPEGNPT